MPYFFGLETHVRHCDNHVLFQIIDITILSFCLIGVYEYQKRNTYSILVAVSERKTPIGKPVLR
jgi:hypothetical protein